MEKRGLIAFFLILSSSGFSAELFYDGFEAGNMNNWVVSGEWRVNGTVALNGTYSAYFNNNATAHTMNRSQSTVGYFNINVSFRAATSANDLGENLTFYWYNGTGWTKQFSQEDITSATFSFLLPSSAADNSNFGISFACINNAATEWCKVDDVRIIGTPPGTLYNVSIGNVSSTYRGDTDSDIFCNATSVNENVAANITLQYNNGTVGGWINLNGSNSAQNVSYVTTYDSNPRWDQTVTTTGTIVRFAVFGNWTSTGQFRCNASTADIANPSATTVSATDSMTVQTPILNTSIETVPSGSITLYNDGSDNFNLTCNVSALVGNASSVTLYAQWNSTGAWNPLNFSSGPMKSNESTTPIIFNNVDNSTPNTRVFQITGYTNGNYAVRCYANSSSQDGSNENSTGIVVVDVTAPPADNTAPNIAGWAFNVSNMPNYSSVQGYQFNATVTDTTGISYVWIEHDFNGTLTNYTVSTNISSTYFYNYAPLAAGYYYMKWYANDSSANKNLNNSDWVHYYQVNKSYLPISLYINGTDGDKILYNNSFANFTANFSAGNAFTIEIWSNLTGSWAQDGSGSSPYELTKTLNPYQARNYLIKANWSGNQNYTYSQANHSLTLQYYDNVLPNIADLKWNVTNSSNYSVTQGYQFNATVADNVNLYWVKIEHNFTGILTNYTVSTSIGSEYYYNYGKLGAGYYTFKWWANDTNGNLNGSETQYYQITRANQIMTVTSSNGTALTYTNYTTITGGGNLTTADLYQNGSQKTSPYIVQLGAGDYNFTWNTTGNQNCTSNTTSITVTVNKKSQTLTISYTPGTILTYGTPLNATGGGNDTIAYLYRNGTQISNGQNYTLAAGTYNYTWNTTGNENYTANSTSNIVTVNKVSQPIIITYTPGTTLAYGTPLNATGSGNMTTSTMYRNGTGITNMANYTLAAGNYNYTWNNSGNENYTANSTSNIITVNKANQILTLTSSNGTTLTYGNWTTITGGGNWTIANLYQNGSVKTSPYTALLGAGHYNFTWNTAVHENYTANSTNITVIVNKANQIMVLTIGPGATVTYGTATTATGTGNGTLGNLYRNGTTVANGETQTLGAGHYNYTFNNSGNENYAANTTSVKVIVNQAPSRAHLVTGPASPITYETQSNFSCWLNVSFAPTLYRNTTDITSENNTLMTRGAGTYLVNCTWPGNENYTGSENTTIYVINQKSQALTATYTPGITLTYGTPLNASGDGNLTIGYLYRNGTQISNKANYTLGAGSYNYTWNTTGNANYTANSTGNIITVNRASQNLALGFNPETTITYGTALIATGSGNNTTANLYKNGSQITNGGSYTLGAGSYNYTWNVTQTENYTANTTSAIVTVNKAPQPLTLTITPSNTETYGTQTTATGSGNLTMGYLYRNNSAKSNPDTAVLGAGAYQYVWNSTGNENYSANTTNALLTINKNSSVITLWINGTTGNRTLYNNSDVNFTARLDQWAYSITLWTNLTGAWTLWDTQDSPLMNYTILAPYQAGNYSIKANWTGNENYTSAQANYTLTLQYSADSIPPSITNLKSNVSNMSVYSPSQSYQFNATISDNVNLSAVWIEHNFTGTLTNYTVMTANGSEYYYDYGALAAGYYQYRWWANDTLLNVNSSEVIYYQINDTLVTPPDVTTPLGGGTYIAWPTPLFDITIKTKDIKLTEKNALVIYVDLINKEDSGKLDVLINYTILDSANNIIFNQAETRAVDGNVSYEKVFSETELMAGEYTIKVELLYGNNQKASANQRFTVTEEGKIIVPAIEEAGYSLPLIDLLLSVALLGALASFFVVVISNAVPSFRKLFKPRRKRRAKHRKRAGRKKHSKRRK